MDDVLVITGDEVLVVTTEDDVILVLETVVELVTVELDGVGGSAAQG